MFNCFHRIILRFTLLFVLLASGIFLSSCTSGDNSDLFGFVLSGDQPIVSSTVTLFRTGTAKGIKKLGSAVTDSTGFFIIFYNAPSDPNAVLYLTADNDLISLSLQTRSSDLNSVRLATVLGQLPV